jgi:hypothetical protein
LSKAGPKAAACGLPRRAFEEFAKDLEVDLPEGGHDQVGSSGLSRRDVAAIWGNRWDLQRILDEYLSVAHELSTLFPQRLTKPRHREARRDRFLIALSNAASAIFGTRATQVVATTGAVIFDDPAINDRLVRRLTMERTRKVRR